MKRIIGFFVIVAIIAFMMLPLTIYAEAPDILTASSDSINTYPGFEALRPSTPPVLVSQSDNTSPDTEEVNEKPITLTYYSTYSPNSIGTVKNLSDLEIYKELEKRTNIKISFINASDDTYFHKLMLMTAAGDLTDLIEFPWQWKQHTGQLENMSSMDAVIELDELIHNEAPNLRNTIESNTEVRRQITSDNGHIYQIPGLNLAKNRVTTGLVIRQDLLKNCQLSIPKTIEEWETMLTIFRDNVGCRIPLSFSMSTFEDSCSFIEAFGTTMGFGVKDGKVFYGPVEESYRDFLSTFSRWYRNGLIDPEFLILSDSHLKDGVNKGDVGAFICRIDDLNESINTLKSINPSYELVPVQNPISQNHARLNISSGIPMSSEYGIAISSRSKYPAEAMKWIDFCYSEEGYRLFNFGIQGLTYTVENDQIKYTDLILNNPDGLSVNQAIRRYLWSFPAVPGYQTDESLGLRYTTLQKDAINHWSNNSTQNTIVSLSPAGTDSFRYTENTAFLMPPVTFTQEQAKEFYTIIDNSVSVYTKEMFAKFVVGAESLDKFDVYVKTAERLGINRGIELLQSAYDRYCNRLPKMVVQGNTVAMDTDPIVFIDGRPLVPIRFVVESLGGAVAWDGKNRIVTAVLKDTAIVLKINSADAMVNNEHENVGMEVIARNNRTYVPANFLEKNLLVDIEWNDKTRTVSID